MNKLLEFKNWDSSFFNQAIYQMDYRQLPSTDCFLLSEPGNYLIQLKIPADCTHALDRAQHLGFRLAEMELSFYHHLDAWKRTSVAPHLREATAQDIPRIMQLAAESFPFSRFRAPWFQETDAGRLYAEWGKKAVLRQFDEVCLKISNEADAGLSGFVSARQIEEHTGQIGLICVERGQQGKNLGALLLHGIEDWALGQQLRTLQVATQGANKKACRFYLRHGYQLQTINYWFYKRVHNDPI